MWIVNVLKINKLLVILIHLIKKINKEQEAKIKVTVIKK